MLTHGYHAFELADGKKPHFKPEKPDKVVFGSM